MGASKLAQNSAKEIEKTSKIRQQLEDSQQGFENG